jgi:hypothetical protein
MAKANSTPLDPAIHRGRLDSLRIYEISEAELDALEYNATLERYTCRSKCVGLILHWSWLSYIFPEIPQRGGSR